MGVACGFLQAIPGAKVTDMHTLEQHTWTRGPTQGTCYLLTDVQFTYSKAFRS